jgi:very-short-patch-repair endonuclease
VEWEVFRTAILEGQGWKLARVWTPHFFRDREGVTAALLREASAAAAASAPSEAIAVTPPRPRQA